MEKKMSVNAKIREYQPEDLEHVLALVKELEEEMAEKFPNIKIKEGRWDYQTRYLQPGNKYKTFIAEVEGKIVGYLIGYPSVGAPELDRMYDDLPVSPGEIPPEFYLQITFVSKPFRNQGISKMLHRKIVDYAREQGHKELYACIAKWNEQEISVIKSLKFEIKDLGYRYRLSLKL
jgi:GNAT superfamily N-acetyltransferase